MFISIGAILVILTEIIEKSRIVLVKSEKRFKDIITNSKELVWEIDPNGKITFISEVVKEIIDYWPKEVMGRNINEFIHSQHREFVKNDLLQANAIKRPLSEKMMKLLHRNGSEVWVVSSGVPIIEQNGELIGYRGISININQIKVAEEREKHISEILRAIHNINLLITTEKDPYKLIRGISGILVSSGRFITAWIILVEGSGKFKTFTLSGKDENILLLQKLFKNNLFTPCGKRAMNESGPHFHCRENDCSGCPIGVICEKGSFRMRLEYEEKIYGLLGVTVSLELIDDDEVRGLFEEVGKDVSFALNHLKVEEDKESALFKFIEAKKRSEFLLDLMSHDIGNMHQGILTGIQLSQLQKDDPDGQEKSLKKCEDIVTRSIKLNRNILLLSNLESSKLDLITIDIVQVVKNTMEDVKQMYPLKNIDFQFEHSENSFNIMAEPLISELFFNIIQNGVKFQSGNEAMIKFLISTHKSNNSIEIQIMDQGPGIPNNMKENIFVRFNRSQHKDSTGIGLSLVKKLVDRYNGSIRVEDRIKDNPSSGANFILTFPAVP